MERSTVVKGIAYSIQKEPGVGSKRQEKGYSIVLGPPADRSKMKYIMFSEPCQTLVLEIVIGVSFQA